MKILIAGAGHVGLHAACEMARCGHEVHVFDRMDEAGVIARYAWADCMELSGVKLLGLPVPSLENGVVVGELVRESPDPDAPGVFQARMSAPGTFLIDRGGLTRWQLARARESGVHLHFNCEARELQGKTGPRLEDIAITGLVVCENGESRAYESDLVVDATGIQAFLRRQLVPDCIARDTSVPFYSSFKSVRRIKGTLTPGEEHFPFRYMGNCVMDGQKGYTWMAPLSEDVVDFGCCVESSIPDGGETGRKIGMEGIHAFPQMAEGEILSEGVGVMPCGDPPATFLASGFAAVGDSAVMTNVIGCGITGGVRTASHLCRLVTAAGDCSIQTLWPAAHRWYTGYGARVVGQKPSGKPLSLEEREFLRRYDLAGPTLATVDNPLLSTEEVGLESPRYPEAKKLRPELLQRLEADAAATQKKLLHFLHYPAVWDSAAFETWCAGLAEL